MRRSVFLAVTLAASVWALLALLQLPGFLPGPPPGPEPASVPALAPAPGPGPFAAPRVFGMLQYDLDGDGRPDLAVIDCAFVTERDFVYVYDGGGDMPSTSDWRAATDFHNDTWLFDIGAKGTIDLALVFKQDRGKDVAYLYDDQNGDGRVSVRRTGRQVVIDESPFWTAKIESGATWTLPDGSLNQNVHILVDGPLSRFGYPESYLHQMRSDGRPDWELGSIDADGDGVPEYSYSLLLAPSPASSQLPRSNFAVNTGGTRPAPADGFAFWPLLGGAAWYDSGNYFDSPFHLKYDWNRRKLADAEVSGYPIEVGYHINTLQYFTRDRVNYADFENPMAYYDLAGDHDGRPELFVRMAYFGQVPPLEEVTYSWNQLNTPNLHWDYKLGLAGRNEIRSQGRIGDFVVQTVPYDVLPRWVVDQRWELATFVAEEGGGYNSSEGIYEWAPLEGVIPDATTTRAPLPGAERAVAEYVLGASDVSPAPYFGSIRAGFRGEYREAPGGVELYFSPIDRRLHLLKARTGIWSLGAGREVRLDSSGGDYLDHWSLRQNGQERRALWHVADQLVLADEAGARLRTIDAPAALFTTAPPTTTDEWRTLGQRVAPAGGTDGTGGADGSGAPFDGADPRALFEQFAGPVQVIPGGVVRDLQATPDGFHFVLVLAAGGGGAPEAPLTRGQPAVEYLVSFAPATGYRLQPNTPPAVELGLTVEHQVAAAAAGTYAVRQPLTVDLRVFNAGLEDARALRVQLVAGDEGGTEITVGTATLDASAEKAQIVSFVWAPPAAGRWTLRARAGGEHATAEQSTLLVVQPEAPFNPLLLLTLHRRATAGLLVLLAAMAATAAMTTLATLPVAGQRGARR